MKLQLYPVAVVITLLATQLCIIKTATSQDCSTLTASYSVIESRCKATGAIKITASGGSGTYNYMVSGPITTGFTSSQTIGGLPNGTYTITVKDIVNGCTFSINSVTVPGSYTDPRFGLIETDVTCTNGNDGSISVSGLTNGLAPYKFSIVAPSPMGIGTTNSSGSFTGLSAGTYSVQMNDSCGSIQTRTISIQNYSWQINASSVTLVNCTNYNAQLTLRDSKGNFNTSSSAFTGFQYGFTAIAGDTTWSNSYSFSFDPGQNRHISLVAKDRCGLVQAIAWSNSLVPSLQANVSITGKTCTGFNAAIMGQQNLTSPTYCLIDGSGNPVTGQPCNSTGAFTNIPYGSYCINMTNTCYDTVITRCFTQVQSVPAITGAIALSSYTCSGATATVTGQQNLTSPQYCLVDGSGNPVTGQPCNGTGVFTNVPYGSYSIQVMDGCAGATMQVSFNSTKKVRSVSSVVSISGNTCSTFNASITGATNFNSPTYCLLDSLGNSLGCNSTGVFNNLNYGSYCVNVSDACADTTIQRCFHQYNPPITGGSGVITNKTCSGFDVTVSGQANVFNGTYCLQDAGGNPVGTVPCNTTGVFTNVPYGSYCIKTTDGCSGTSNTVCFNVTAPTLSVGPVTISNTTCAGFTATLTGQQNLTSPTYCLFDSANNAVGACNSTGVFAIGTYGSYSIQTTDGCLGQVFNSPFSVTRPVPGAGATVNFSNQSCSTFSAQITGQVNLTNPHYYLKDNTGTIISDNSTGGFDNIAYGSYCIDIVNGCSDTTIGRCFTTMANAMAMTLAAKPSCTYQTTDLSINVTSGGGPYTVAVYDSANNFIKSVNSASASFSVTGLPSTGAAQQYKVVLTGSCGTPDTTLVLATPSKLSRNYNIVPKCPSSIQPTGSGDINITASSNLAGVNLSITQKDGASASISYSYNSGSNYTFSNLDAGTYVVTYTFSSCSGSVSDTVIVPSYIFPSLDKSSAYQCDNNSFTINGDATGGMAPFNYQIIGSEPDTPNINTGLQSSPLFNINTGTQYALIRLRAIDACGNSALNDVDILPLQNTIISASLNCIYKPTTLTTNPLPNATYTWYFKSSMDATDSTELTTADSYTIPSIMVSDTGIYINHISVNNGCLTKLAYFHLDGMCNGMWTLPINVTLTGSPLDGSNVLAWQDPGDQSIQQYVVERKGPSDNSFLAIGTVPAAEPGHSGYSFNDMYLSGGTNLYRLKVIHNGNAIIYSNTVQLKAAGDGDMVSIYPNPVFSQMNISIRGNQANNYTAAIYSAAGQLITRMEASNMQSGTLTYRREDNVRAGIYFVKVWNTGTGEIKVFKVTFK